MSLFEILFPPIINSEGKKCILEHKYVPGVKSFIMPYLDPWWEFVVSYIPSWIAPNTLTLTSLIIQLTACYVYSSYEPLFNGTYNSFILYIYLLISLFLYQTLDAIDGKHARNTLNSSPLGQLFDHGCDAICCTKSIIIHGGIMGIGTNWMGLYVIIMSQIIFYALNWRARHLGQFDFGQFSVDETMLLGMIIFAITSITGPNYWQSLNLFGIISPQIFLLISLSASIIHNCYYALYQVNKHYNSVTSKEKKKFYNERFYELGNVFIFHLSLCFWNLCGIFNKYPILFISTSAFTFAHLVHRLIICDVSKQKSRRIQYIIIPFIIIAIISIFEYANNGKPILFYNISMNDYKIIFIVFCYTTYIMIIYAMRCMIDISNLLNIRIFLINPPKITSNNKGH